MQLNLTPDPTANGAASRPAEPAAKPLAPAAVAPLLADARGLVRLLAVGLRTVRQLDAAGKLPRPIKLGSRTLWNIQEIQDWIEAGAPDRATWEAFKKSKRR
jgi:predicted DNA-binding transcriptional regulator AlpA